MSVGLFLVGIALIMTFSWISLNVKRVGDIFRDGMEEIINSINPK